MNKPVIRKKILKIRRLNKFKNLKINLNHILKILKINKFNNKIVGGYYPYNYEVDVIEILKKLEKRKFQVSLPRIKNNHQMDFFYWKTEDPLKINKYGIPEPISEKVMYPSVLLVPLVAFDNNLNRVGYGGGFYDRYIKRLKKNKKVILIGLAYSYQKVKKIPTNKYDIKLDFVVTE